MYMSVLDEMNENMRKTGREWVEWAKAHAQDLSERGIRHLERQDLLADRKRIVNRVGEYVVERLIDEEKKTIRTDAADLAVLLQRIRAINSRLEEIENADKECEDEDAEKKPAIDPPQDDENTKSDPSIG